MSAKKTTSGAAPAPVSPSPSPAPASAPEAGESASWLDGQDPQKRLWGKVILGAVWLYVAALWLLALDQTFHWGIFGPKVPPLP